MESKRVWRIVRGCVVWRIVSQFLIEPVWNQNTDNESTDAGLHGVSISNRTSMESKLFRAGCAVRVPGGSQFLIEPVWNQNDFLVWFLFPTLKTVSISNRTSMESKLAPASENYFTNVFVSISNRTSMESKPDTPE